VNSSLPTIEGGWHCILADPPWEFKAWVREVSPSDAYSRRAPYGTMTQEEMASLPVGSIAGEDCALFMWGIWVSLPDAIDLIEKWGFTYKTCAFVWTKADIQQMEMFEETESGEMGLGYWVRQNTEFCLLGTKGSPKRLSASVRQAIIERRREHSRKPDCVHERIERLIDGPYLELFARKSRLGWTTWGNQATKFDEVAA
jgi:N6-adenosine-specific RNA methylase IME4